MYRVRLKKVIWRDEDRKELYAELFRDIELPFPPSIGLEVSFRGWSSDKADKVTWIQEDERFEVVVKYAVHFYASGEHYTVEWLLQHLLEIGWLNFAARRP